MPTPRLSAESLRDVAIEYGVCVRPLVQELHDTVTGDHRLVPIPCGSTLETRCPACAERNVRLRKQQCREGWHLEEEPEDDDSQPGDDSDDADEGDDSSGNDSSSRRVRSTRRRQDAPDLPRLPVENRTVGRTFTAPNGKTYRPSMFATFTLPSYGRVRPDGTPIDPSTYDYRRAALDAMHFAKLLDRLWQNLRRAVGYQVQYFAAVEPQRRLAPHLHAAIRGAIPRDVFRRVVTATYHQVWWPPYDEVLYPQDRLPEWVEGVGYVDQDLGVPLPTWDEALDELDADPAARPAHLVRFGKQLDLQGIIATSSDADRRVRYLTKYLTKSIGADFDDDTATPAQRAHLDRLHREVRWLPCSPRCWNWLRYGVQPQGAEPGMVPGCCPNKAHDREHLGCGGRRVLVSRKWTGKTLSEHKADKATVVAEVLAAAGMEMPDTNRCSATAVAPDGRPRYLWSAWRPKDRTTPLYRQVMAQAIDERMRWRAQYEKAKERAGPYLSAIRQPTGSEAPP
jgi:hypothetical protein